jgi:hypothetical protein
MVSNLDTNMLEPFGAPLHNQDDQANPTPEVTFTQNTVPFDFDGDRLLWMNYQSRDLRDVNLYNFPLKTLTTVVNFQKRDGIISHMKLLGDCLYYVKNTRDLVRYDMKTHSSSLIGSTRDAVIALYVSRNKVREFDKEEDEKLGGGLVAWNDEIDEEAKSSGEEKRYTIACLDEAENLYVFKAGGGGNGKKVSNISTQIKTLANVPEEIR